MTINKELWGHLGISDKLRGKMKGKGTEEIGAELDPKENSEQEPDVTQHRITWVL